jgi:hypothetical protein
MSKALLAHVLGVLPNVASAVPPAMVVSLSPKGAAKSFPLTSMALIKNGRSSFISIAHMFGNYATWLVKVRAMRCNVTD